MIACRATRRAWAMILPMALALPLALAACRTHGDRSRQSSSQSGAGVSQPLRVVAPHFTKLSLDRIHGGFATEHPGVEIEFETARVNTLCAELASGSPSGDVLFMVDGPEMRMVEESGRIDSARRRAYGHLNVVVVAPKGNPKGIHTIQDLARCNVGKLALPNPETDATGEALVCALQAAGIWDAVRPKAQILESPHVSCDLVERGEADAGVTYSPCVLFGHSKEKLCIAAFLPKGTSKPLDVFAAPFADTNHPLVGSYMDYLLSHDSQRIVGSVGFVPAKVPPPARAERSLVVPCGAGLQPAMDPIGELYYQRTGTRVDFSYAGAGMLLADLAFSRRGDLYIPGESFYVDLAKDRGFIDAERPVVYFLPVIIVQEGNPRNIRGLHDLARPGLRVALGDPEALAVGPVTQRILERAELLGAVERNVSMKAGCIPELANAVSMRTADAGIVWDAVARQHDKHVDIVPILADYNEVAEVLVTTLTCSKQPDEARRLMEFIASDEAAALFHRYGFNTERPEGVRPAPHLPPKKRG